MAQKLNLKCFAEQRDLITPNGKLAVLCIDMDGTTIECQPYFDEAFEEFALLMSLLGVPHEESTNALKRIYYGSMPHRGFERHRFPEALVETYEDLRKRFNLTQVPDQQAEHFRSLLKGIGSAPFFRRPKLFTDCIQVLTQAHERFLLVAVTVGDYEAQLFKIRQSGLEKLFDDRIITLTEGKDKLVAQLIEDYNIDPEYSAFIGNSVRSDGVCLNVMNFIHVPFETSLSKDGDKLPENTGFKVFPVKNWRDAQENAINRLIRQRDMALSGIGTTGGTCGSSRPARRKPRATTGKKS
ncbi:MAG: HAD family hydrolase [Candidatus Obscuribacter sp.]|nr:HAD family hydrolase [Candidatus Obscuribacter sp.]MBL8082916.1 HAD family hydrolase [Candidatus Obscuribacter sp.]